jgi:hypothetical protein
MIRDDLLALTADALAALANRGLVNRATKELDAGRGPDVTASTDGTVRGLFPDGVRTTLPAGASLAETSCSCPASGICRHRIGLVLAYQRTYAGGASRPEFTPWSPGDFDDTALAGLLGSRKLIAARRTLRAGYSARLRRPTPDNPQPSVDLGTCTVRFLVPGQLRYVHTDAASGARDDAVALAVWAFREADRRKLGGDEIQLDVGGRPASAAGTGLEPAVELADALLLDGAMHAGPGWAATLTRARRELEARHLRWPLTVLDELAEQLDVYRARGAHYRADRFAELLTEIHARHRAATGGASPRTQVLGSDEPAETPLRRVRLTGLGCRVRGAPDHEAELFLATADGAVLVLRKQWQHDEARQVTGHDLAGRRVGGAPLAAVAAGNLVTESAVRTAGRVVRLASSRVARTTVTPSTGDWDALADTILVRDLTALRDQLADLPPRLIRPRIETALIRAVAIAEVRGTGYHPGDQRLDAVVADAAGVTAVVSARYDPVRPAALDTLDRALRGGFGTPRFVSGVVRRTRGTVVIDPTAVVAGTAVILPDLAAGDGSPALPAAAAETDDPVTAALDGALAVCAEAAHRGLDHLPPGFGGRVDQAVQRLVHIGLPAAARALSALATALRQEDRRLTITAWVDAQIRLVTTADLR